MSLNVVRVLIASFALLAAIAAHAAAPTFVGSVQSTWGSSGAGTRDATAISVQAGDIIVAGIMAESNGSSFTEFTDTQSNVYTNQETIDLASNCELRVSTAVAGSTGSLTVTGNKGATGLNWGFAVQVWRASDGIGAAEKTNSTGAPSLAITTVQANSGISIFSCDFNAIDGAARTWRSVNGSAATEDSYHHNAAAFTTYSGHHVDAGSAASKTTGLSAPTGQAYATVSIEVKGTGGGGGGGTGLILKRRRR